MSIYSFFTASSGFESARQITLLPAGHRGRRLHGHSFLANVRAAIPPNWAHFPGGEIERLNEELTHCTTQLDYKLLNALITQPTDRSIAQWIQTHLNVPGLRHVGLQSTSQEGVDLNSKGITHIWKRYSFQAAHRLPNVAPYHQCGRMHGHGFDVILHAQQAAGENEQDFTYDHLDASWAPLQQQLSYACLNELPGLENPTSENISSWLWERLKPALPTLTWITVYETASCGANFDGHDYRIWKDFTLDSALQLKRAPDGSPLRRIHGHTYTLRLHLQAELDTVMGWTMDFGDVKQLFTPIFKSIDHQPLHEIPALQDCDTASVAQWILARSRSVLPHIARVDLFETRGNGFIVSVEKEGLSVPI